MRQKGTVQVPSSFFMSVNPSSTNQRRRRVRNTICSVSYCILHCRMRELWEGSTLPKNLIEDVKSWRWIPSIVNLSISLSLSPSHLCLGWITARPQTQPVTHLGRFIGSERSASAFVWNHAVCRQLQKLSQHFVAGAERVNLMKPVKNTSKSRYTWKSK